MDVALVAAVAENGVIGRDNGLPWHLPDDLRRFKALTLGKPVIMGRRTYESIGRPLPGRLNIVVTRERAFRPDGVEVAASIEDAIRLAGIRARCMSGADEICIIGGGQVYAQAIAGADRLYITHVAASPAGNTRFPDIDPSVWRLQSVEEHPANGGNSHATRYAVYVRRGPAADGAA